MRNKIPRKLLKRDNYYDLLPDFFLAIFFKLSSKYVSKRILAIAIRNGVNIKFAMYTYGKKNQKTFVSPLLNIYWAWKTIFNNIKSLLIKNR